MRRMSRNPWSLSCAVSLAHSLLARAPGLRKSGRLRSRSATSSCSSTHPRRRRHQIQQVTDAFQALTTSIPGITGFEHGVNNSPEKLNQGFTHVYVVTFENAAARDAYLPHPEHRKFGELLGKSGIFVGAFVVDYAPTVRQDVPTPRQGR